MATYAIGDIQGCYDELKILLDIIKFQSEQDKLLICGDIINRGPKSLETLEFLYSIKKNCHITLGNHDLHFLAVAEGVKEISESDTFQALLEDKNLDIYVSWIRELPFHHISNIKIKDPDFDDTVVKMQFDEFGPFNPKDPLKNLKKQTEGIDTIKPKKNPDDPEKFYTGGMVDVEPNLSDIGHGSDSLMARTRLISPNNQATTSTGLNYLLAEDNDNIRVPFNKGGGGGSGRGAS